MTNPPPHAGQYPPASYPQPGQYPPPGQPGQYPPSGQPGQYPPPGQPGQYPPSGLPGQYPPPGLPGQYPPPGQPGQPGQYPPPGLPGQYPAPGQPGQYPPPGQPGQYPPPGQPGQYPPPGQPGQYHPPGQYPPEQHGQYYPAAPGQYPPQCPPTGQYPPPSGHPVPGQGPPLPGWDAEDSDNEDFLRSKHSRHRVNVKFINKSHRKVKLLWINEKGKLKKMEKIKEGRTESIDTYESHPFTIYMKKGPEMVINGNFTFFPEATPGGHGEVKAEITAAPVDVHSLRSTTTGHPVRVKFSNRTTRFAVLKFVDHFGKQHYMKEIAPKKAFVLDTCEGFYFVAHEKGFENNTFEFNYGWFYLVKKPLNPAHVQKVIITEPYDDHASSSSD